ncbi:unnamed protein product [Amoebophrya sp. A25]|nr:unnamed protein product [Amoebophrya sp. A25]|eukprot:GSA25T00017800001.1
MSYLGPMYLEPASAENVKATGDRENHGGAPSRKESAEEGGEEKSRSE